MLSGRIISGLIFVASFIYYVKKQSRRKKLESKSEDKISKTEAISDPGKGTEFMKEERKSVTDATVDDGYDGDTSNMSVCDNENVEICTKQEDKSKLDFTSDPSQSCVEPSQADLDDTMTVVAKLLALAEEQEAEFKKVESEVEMLKASPRPSLNKSEASSVDSSAAKIQSEKSSSKTPIHPRVQLLKEGSFSFRSSKENLKPSPPNVQKSSTSPRNAKLPAKVNSGLRPLFTIGKSPITNSTHAKPSPPFYSRVAGTASSKSLPAKTKTTSERVAKPKSLKTSSGTSSKNETKRFKPLHYKGAPQAKPVGLKERKVASRSR